MLGVDGKRGLPYAEFGFLRGALVQHAECSKSIKKFAALRYEVVASEIPKAGSIPAKTCKIIENKLLSRRSALLEQSSPLPEGIAELADEMLPVQTCQTRNLKQCICLEEAKESLNLEINKLKETEIGFASGVIRLQVPLPNKIDPLHWLRSQQEPTFPRIYFSERAPRGSFVSFVSNLAIDGREEMRETSETQTEILKCSGLFSMAGLGSAMAVSGNHPFSDRDWKSMKRYLSASSPLVRFYGGMRFDSSTKPSNEWAPFGSFTFIMPVVELVELEGCSVLACNLLWDSNCGKSLSDCLDSAQGTLNQTCLHEPRTPARLAITVTTEENLPDEEEWHRHVEATLSAIRTGVTSPLDGETRVLSKVVMARQTKIETSGPVDPLDVLSILQDEDPGAYQFLIQLATADAFLGSTPERLYRREGCQVASEAVAATRPRGDTVADDEALAMELMSSEKDFNEFAIVRESVYNNLAAVCKSVCIDPQRTLVKQARVQHLYSRIDAVLHHPDDEYKVLSVLHPTPAVCGHPQSSARDLISRQESFDRGMYAGPIGWFGGSGSEFVIGIRSALFPAGSSRSSRNNGSSKPASSEIILYAGVGVVTGTQPDLEWKELNLKTSQFEALLMGYPPLSRSPNVNSLWATLIVEECCRLGVNYFCVAPGSRSSPLAIAAALNPRVRTVVCIDERSLAFHALGYAKGAGKPAAVVSSSGTAVANLLPAVVEASQDCVPMLLLTADRPHELRDTGANQTIDQVKIFGTFVRHQMDLPCPDDKVPARLALTSVDSAVYRAMSHPRGPVHLNLPLREPLAPVPLPWDQRCLEGTQSWFASSAPFTSYLATGAGQLAEPGLAEILTAVRTAEKGLLVVGSLHSQEDVFAVASLAEALDWPVYADVLSGLRLAWAPHLPVVHFLDHALLEPHADLAPDVVLQIGARLTSKRVAALVEDPSRNLLRILVESHPFRADASHSAALRVQTNLPHFSACLVKALRQPAALGTFLEPSPPTVAYRERLLDLSRVAEVEIDRQLASSDGLTEPWIARTVAATLSPGDALFLGNSMPIRDVDMYASAGHACAPSSPACFPRVAANRGASGIDGVLSTAVGFAAGSRRPVTLLIGDVSFLHDTNGLSLLQTHPRQPPVSVVVVNNRGGGIFSLLPVRATLPDQLFSHIFSTPHSVHIQSLCQAHGVRYSRASTKEEFLAAMAAMRKANVHWVLEVCSAIPENTRFHQEVQACVRSALQRALDLQRVLKSSRVKIQEAKIADFRIQLAAPTTAAADMQRSGSFLEITLENGAKGYGEISPLPGLHAESATDAAFQTRAIAAELRGQRLTADVALFGGHLSHWIAHHISIPPEEILPSVRFGVESAIVTALSAASQQSLPTFLQIGTGQRRARAVKSSKVNGSQNGSLFDRAAETDAVFSAGLVDWSENIDEVVQQAVSLVYQGFKTLKLKAARPGSTPSHDATLFSMVEAAVGPAVALRVDANKGWTLPQAVEFTSSVDCSRLEFIEEPLQDWLQLQEFFHITGVPYAIDESLPSLLSLQSQTPGSLQLEGLKAVVLKPSVLGLEASMAVLQRACPAAQVIISSAFESALSLSLLASLACYSDRVFSSGLPHGLGTFTWLPHTQGFTCQAGTIILHEQQLAIHVGRAAQLSCNGPPGTAGSFQEISSALQELPWPGTLPAHFFLQTFSLKPPCNSPVALVFLAGFMGSPGDWLPVLQILSPVPDCLCLDLSLPESLPESPEPRDLTWAARELLQHLDTSLGTRDVVLVGYSMGGRLALEMAVQRGRNVDAPGLDPGHVRVVGAVLISASPGLKTKEQRERRARADAELAESLRRTDVGVFVSSWYQGTLWESLRRSPCFSRVLETRKQSLGRPGARLAAAGMLEAFSTGKQRPRWNHLGMCEAAILLVVGELDTKFCKIAADMEEVGRRQCGSNFELESREGSKKVPRIQTSRVKNAGHAVHIEDPLAVAKIIHGFIETIT